jgi:hypothetical protein
MEVHFGAESAPDLDRRTWLRDFLVLGACIGSLAPTTVLAFVTYRSGGVGLVPIVALVGGFGGGTVGLGVGALACAMATAMSDRPLWLAGLGFPLGFAAGGAVGVGVGELLHTGGSSTATLVGALGAVTGGLILGFTWLPYLALKLRGRSGLPVMLAAGIASPVVGPLVLGLMLVVLEQI